MTEQAGDLEQALLRHAERQTKALEHIVNLMWFWIALAAVAAVLLVLSFS